MAEEIPKINPDLKSKKEKVNINEFKLTESELYEQYRAAPVTVKKNIGFADFCINKKLDKIIELLVNI